MFCEGKGGGGRNGGGSRVDFVGTLTGRLQWGHSTLSRALLSSTEMVSVHQGQSKWIAIPSIQPHCAVKRAGIVDDMRDGSFTIRQSSAMEQPSSLRATAR
jgi:hypothetical protein